MIRSWCAIRSWTGRKEAAMKITTIVAAMTFFALTLAVPAIAAPDAAERARIDEAMKAYALGLDIVARHDIDQRVVAAWPALATDPASPVIGNPKADVTIV